MNYEHLFWSAVLDLLHIYLLGLMIGTIIAIIKFGSNKKLTWFEAWAPAFIWPLALIKESIKYLKK